jgi:GT2 family glycosyltransferase
VKLLNEDRELDYVYSDEDKINLNGRRVEPYFKPDWSPDLLLSMNYVGHFGVYRTSLLRSLGGFRDGYEGSQHYDLVLRATEKTNRIGHVRKVAYGRRISRTSVGYSDTARPVTYASALKVLQEAVARRGIKAQVEMLPIHDFRVKYQIKGNPIVTIIIPARTTEYIGACVRSIIEKTTYDEYEVLVVDRTEMDLQKILEPSEKLRFIIDSSNFNFSRINNEAAKSARGEYLVFLNDDTEVISGEWLSAMLEHAQREEVGAVGAKLLRANGTVQHAGIIVGIQGYAANYGGMAALDPGYFASASVVRNCTAVTGACMMVRKNYFIEMGGFDEALGHSWNDVDLGIRVVQQGRWVVYTPLALLYHYVGGTRGERDVSSEELKAKALFRKKNIEFLRHGDQFYNPNLSTNEAYLYLPKCNPHLLSDLKIVPRHQSKSV